MVHMKQSAAKAKAEVAPEKTPKGPTYPWGLSMSLDHDALAKLGIDGPPKAGTAVTFRARGHVKSSNSRQEESGKMRHSAEIQITHLGLGGDTKSVKTLKPDGPKVSKVRTLKTSKAKE